jgi:transcriptional regulator with XRE-family HTH domain
MMHGSLPAKLRVLRARQGLTLIDAAEKIGIGRDTLSDLERGNRHPVMPTLAKIAEGYGVPVEELLEEEPVAAGNSRAPQETGRSDGEAGAKLEEIRESYRGEREGVEELLSRWERWLETGGIPEEAVREFLVEARAWFPVLRGALETELTVISGVLDIEPSPYLPEEAMAESSLLPLVDRYWEIGRKLTEIWSERFPEEPPVDLEAMRQDRLSRRAG